MKKNIAVMTAILCAALIMSAVTWRVYDVRRRAKEVQSLLRDLTSSDEPVRAAAREKLVKSHDAAAINGLVEALASREFYQSHEAHEITVALVDIGEPAVEPLLDALPREAPQWLKFVPPGVSLPGLSEPASTPAAATVLVTMGKTAVPALERALKGGSRIRRALAAVILGRIQDPSCVPALEAAARDKDLTTRVKAVVALGEIHDPSALAALLAIGTHVDPNMQLAMVTALRHCGGEKAVEAIEKLTKDTDPVVCAAALDALGALDEKKATAIANLSIDDPSPAVRTASALILKKAASPKVVDALIAALSGDDEDAELNAAYALGEIGDRKAVEPLIAAATANRSPARRAVFSALKGFADRRAVPACIAAFSDEDPRVRTKAVSVLEYLIDERARKPLMSLFKTEQNRDVRNMIIYALGRYNNAEAIDMLVEAYKDGDVTIRTALVDILALSVLPQAKALVIKSLGDAAPDVRRMALKCLWARPNPDGLDAIAVLVNDPDAKVRTDLTMALGYSKSLRAVQPLLALLEKDSDMVVRLNAARALSLFKDERAVEPLINALKDPAGRKDGLDTAAAYALLTIGGEKANAAVDEAVKGFDIPALTAGYAQHIRESDMQYIVPLSVALMRSGDMKMAEDFYWSGNYGLNGTAEWWAQSVGRRKELLASTDSPGRPKWQAKEERAKTPMLFERRLTEIKDTDPKKRARAASSIGSYLRMLAPREGASVFDNRKGVVVKSTARDMEAGDMEMMMEVSNEAEDEMNEDLRARTTPEQKVALVNALIAASKDPDAGVRSRAALSLGFAADPIVLDALSKTLKDADPRVRAEAAQALRRIRNPRSTKVLIEALGDKDESVRETVIWSLSKLGDAAAVEPLIAALKNSSVNTKRHAAVALGYLGGERALAVLKEALEDHNAVVVAAAAIGLQRIGTPDALASIDKRAVEVNADRAAERYKTLIARGDDKDLIPLALALVRHADSEMATIYYWSGNKDLLDAAETWDDVRADESGSEYVGVIDWENYSSLYPMWPGGTLPPIPKKVNGVSVIETTGSSAE